MVRHHGAAQHMHQFIVSRGRGFLKEAVGVPVIAHPIDYFTAVHIAGQKFIQRLDILLQIGINGDHHVRILSGRHHTC